MSRRVATITLNPAYDLVGYTPEIERGEVNWFALPACMLRVKVSTWRKC